MAIKRLVILSIILLLTGNLWADVLYTKITTLAKYSFDIIEGKVIKVETKWDKKHNSIYTYATVRILKSYKNKVKVKEITIKDIGGSLDGYTTYAPCQAKYKKGESVMIFLQKEELFYRTYGLNQGKFTIKNTKRIKHLVRDINPDELIILNKEVKKEEIKREFRYSDMKSLIVKAIENNKIEKE